MYFIKSSRRRYLAAIGLLFLMVAGFLFPFLFPAMGVVATSIFFSLGGISLGLSLSYIFFRLYKWLVKPLEIIKNNERSIVDNLLGQAEEHKKGIEVLAERLLVERHRHEQLQKESEKLDSELLALQSSPDNPNAGFATQPVSNEATLNEYSALLKKPSPPSPVYFYDPLFQAATDRGKESTVSDVEEIHREINENLIVFQEAAAQLKQDQGAALAAEVKKGQDKKVF